MTKDLQKRRAWRIALFVLLLSVAGIAKANPVDRRYARIVATHFLDINGGRSNDLTDISEAAGFEHLYVFATDNSFVIVADDNRVQPILGYSFSGQFASENMPDNIRGWLQGYSNMVQAAIENQQRATAEVARQWTDLYEGNPNTDRAVSVVAPLVQTQWNQDSPYNLLCPSNSVTGCVATAMAQVMKYWNYPAHGIGSHSYIPTSHPEYGELTADFNLTNYNWTNMTNSYSSSSTETQKQAVAALMYHCGVSVNMDYSPSSSGAASVFVPFALKSYFNYSSDAQFLYRADYSDDTWISMLKADLDLNRPIYYSGSGSGGGHAFVCDGYNSSNYFHFNWGWGGYCDAYYTINNLNPGPGGIGSGSYGVYNNNQGAVFGVHPAVCTASAPTNLTYTQAGEHLVTLSWQTANGATRYNIYRNNTYLGYGDNAMPFYLHTAPYGNNIYYIRSVDSNGRLSLSSNAVTVNINGYETPSIDDLEATVSGNSVNLNWDVPAWCYPETPTATLSYGDGSAYYSWSSTYYGHRYPASSMAQYANKSVYKIGTYIKYPGTYTVYIYTNSSSGKPSANALAATKTVDYYGLNEWIDIVLDQPVIISGNTDLWVVMKQENTGESYPVPSFNLSSYNSNACYAGNSPTNISSLSSSNSVSWFIRTYITDGIYNYNIYRNNAILASNVSNPNYIDINIPSGVYTYYIKTNYYAGESDASNQVSVQINPGNYNYIAATANPAIGGHITGAGSYLSGSTCSLTATPESGYVFINWSENGNLISTEPTISFTVSENRSLVANFAEYSGSGLLEGVFSVGQNSLISFSQGNLQYKASTNKWRFAENQWDYVGEDNANISSVYDSWIDLFGWGTSGYNHNNSCYQPWSISQTDSDYYAYGASNYNLYDQTGKADWGYNAIVNGGNTTNTWHTLTADEWDFVLNTRNTASGIRFAHAQVNDVRGLILLPDDWDATYFTLHNTNGLFSHFSDNIITATQWTVLENHGAVFLPAAGWRNGTYYHGIVEIADGGYWSSSSSSDNSSVVMYFDGGYYGSYGEAVVTNWPRHEGNSVRLVQSLQSTSYNINVTPNPADGGTITGGGVYASGQYCVLTATPAFGYVFVNWTENGNPVSSETSFSFTVNGNRSLTANFEQVEASGLLNGVFSAGPNVQIGFSQGNLQYQATTNIWRFADNQWDYVGSQNPSYGNPGGTVSGSDNTNISSTYSGWIALFGWGTSGYDHGAECYQPWSSESGSSSYRAYGNSNYNLYDQTGQADWGYNAISNGGNVENTWRTLTKDEWNYMLNTRGTASGIRYVHACVNEVNGVIVLPDDWDTTYYTFNNTNGVSGASYNSNIINATQWNGLQQHGAVFLPITGQRLYNATISSLDYGHYWSSSCYNSSYAYSLQFSNGYLTPNYRFDYKYFGNAVRLVRPLQATSYNINVTPSPSAGGTITGDGTYAQGQYCILTATPNAGYAFMNWTENGNIVSQSANYTFLVNESRNLVANFTQVSTAGMLTGEFTVGENTIVCFSQGNLQYRASTNTWQFASNQYAFIGATNSRISQTYTGWIDLFGWGTSGWDCGNTYYQPWDSDNSDGTLYGPPGTLDLTGDYALSDWGIRNAISNGGNTAGLWRTLTSEEWDYLFNTRSASTVNGTANARYAKAKVVNVYGVILFPDNYTHPSDVTQPVGINVTGDTGWSGNTYNATSWNKMQNAGAVFLPAAGSRYGTTYSNTSTLAPGGYGYYWSATSYPHDNNWNYAYKIYLSEDYMSTWYNSNSRYYGMSVRLVRSVHETSSYNINATPNPTEGGVVTGGGIYNHLQTCTLTATPNEGYTFDNWTENGNVVSTSATYTFPVSGNRNLVAHFHSATPNYMVTVTASPAEGGTVNGGGNYQEGQNCTVTAAPNSGYNFINWTENGNEVSTDASYTFTVTGNRALVANFTGGTQGYTISISANPTNGGTVTGSGTYSQGSTCTITATANSGYAFTNWTENGDVVSTNMNYTFIVEADMTIIANFATIPFNVPTGAINGLFSVSADQQVWFSQGNLQYIGSAATPYWKFAENQWDYLGTSQNGTNQTIDRDLFGWGTSGYNHGAVCYAPWSTNGSSSNYYAYGSEFYNLNDQTGMADWGYNAISNGGNLTNMWRTLTTEEWTYLFETRTTASGIRYASACVNSINGIIVLPDNWDPSYFELNDTNGSSSSGASYNSNIISAAQWSILEQHGAVFLPAAGRRNSGIVTLLYSGNPLGYYWSSSYSTSTGAYKVSFSNGGIITNTAASRDMGNSVRLVQSNLSYSYEIEASPNPAIGGSVIGSGTYQGGQTCTLTAAPNPGYTFSNWTEDGSVVSTDATYSFEVTGPRNLVANFEAITNHWTPENPGNYSLTMALTGIIQIDGIEQFSNQLEVGTFCNGECRGSQMASEFFLTNRYLVQLSIAGEIGDMLTFKLYDHALAMELDLTSPDPVTFTTDGYGTPIEPYALNFISAFEITAMVNPEGAGIVTGTGSYTGGTTCTLVAEPNPGFQFEHWTLDGEVVSTNTTYEFTVTQTATYVAHFQSVHTQPLSTGWNWYSTYIEQSVIDGLTMLENSLGSNGVRIQSKNNGYVDQFDYNGTSYWYGTLNALTNEQMYMVRTNTDCDASMTGSSASFSQHPITISNGWNWIGFPSNESISVSSALSGFTPEANDQIKSKNNGYSTYVVYGSNALWYGTLNTLEPGQGYMYKSNSTATKTLTYQGGRGETLVGNVTADGNTFMPKGANYAHNMTVTAVVELEGDELRSEDYELAAFVGDECRGSVKLMYVEPLDRYLAFLLVSGETEMPLQFVLTDGRYSNWSDDELVYTNDATIGTPSSPFVIHFGTLGVGENGHDKVRVFPNPSSDVFNVEGNGMRKVEVVNAYGQVIYDKVVKGDFMQINLGNHASGVYLLRVVTDKEITTQQIIKK